MFEPPVEVVFGTGLAEDRPAVFVDIALARRNRMDHIRGDNPVVAIRHCDPCNRERDRQVGQVRTLLAWVFRFLFGGHLLQFGYVELQWQGPAFLERREDILVEVIIVGIDDRAKHCVVLHRRFESTITTGSIVS